MAESLKHPAHEHHHLAGRRSDTTGTTQAGRGLQIYGHGDAPRLQFACQFSGPNQIPLD